jgi:hypothetical protein
VAIQNKSARGIGSPKRLAVRSAKRRSEPTSEHANQPAAVVTTQVGQGAQGRSRKTGKRSDPAFRPTTFFVRKETQRKASRMLEDQEAGKDLSDLVEELLAKWVAEHSHA